MKQFSHSKKPSKSAESVKYSLFAIWDFIFFLVAVILLSFVLLCLLSMFGLTNTSDETTIAMLASFVSALCICGKAYRRKRLKRKLQQTNREIERLENEIAELKALKQLPMFESVSFVDQMDGYEFEHWCAELLLKIGFESADVTQASGDDGVDIIAVKDDVRYAIQCKRYNSDLGNTPIQEVYTGKAVYGCDVAAVMTNRYFTAGAKRAAEATGTRLWDRNWIADKLCRISGSVMPSAVDPKPSTIIEPSDNFPVSKNLSQFIHKAQWYAASQDRDM